MNQERTGRIGIRLLAIVTILTAMCLTAPALKAMAGDAEDAQAFVERARITFGEFMRDDNYSWMRNHLKDAKGVLIYPQVLKAGYILGGSGGTGVLMVREGKGGWSHPAFYTMGSVSFGLQIGGESAEVIMLVMSQKGIDSLLSSKMKLGGDASAALGPIGGGAEGDVTVDFLSFAKSKGLYAGLNLNGSYISVRDGLNKAYYGRDVTPVDIIVKQSVGNKAADSLREELKKAAK